ncbi:MAG: aromatic ring-hydroxylating dioxygenase subunit alpha [Alphaproteobacteria bacterium]|nr:aromatic ring-hydroxylating dioxygenase subunit alpha [Alphaproteobacteria bacterium]
MFLRNCWYAGAWSHEVEGEALLARKILGERIVFYRKQSGGVAALTDRCSHRFAPLSLGRREGDCLRCMYHGLMFDAGGVCVEEPGRKVPSPRTDIRAYPVVERWKLVWIWMGDPARADPALIPPCPYIDSPEWACIPAYMHFKADYRLVMDNLLDFSHLSFVHANTLGGSNTIAEIRPKIDQLEGGVRITRWYLGEPELAPYLKGIERFQGPVDRWNIYEVALAGCVFEMDSGSAPAGTGAPDGRLAPEAMHFHSIQIVTPEDERNSHYFWMYAHNFDLQNAALTKMLSDRVEGGFVEDRTMIEAQQQVIAETGEAGMAYIHFDNAMSLYRRLLSKAIAQEQEQAAAG